MDYIIETDFEGPGFVAVPNEVAQSGKLSPEALGVLVYFASLPRGWIARVAAVRESFGIGKDKWQRIARELRDVGAMEVREVPGKGGRFAGRSVVVRWPRFGEQAESRETRPSDRKPGKPAVGKPAQVSRETRQTGPENPAPYKEERKTNRGAARKTDGSHRPRHRSPHESGGGAASVELVELGEFQRAYLRQGRDVPTWAGTVKAATAEHKRLAAELADSDGLAEKGRS